MPPRSGVRLAGATTGSQNGAAAAPHARTPTRRGLAGIGAAGYLWLLVVVEALAIGLLRHTFRDHHGG